MSRLHGPTTAHYGSPHRTQTLAGATLVFYPTKPTNEVSRWGWRSIDELPDGEVGRTVVADDGTYEVTLDHDGGSVLVAIEVDRFTYAPATNRTARGFLGTGVVGGEDQQTMAIELAPHDVCALLRALDLWLVAGRVTNCGTPIVPADNATVTVFDRDWTQDDTLGSDTTDSAGTFEIFFPRSTFHQIPAIPPPFDWILPHELFGGPDVYCRVVRSGVTLIDENPAVGRTPARQNRPHCTYLELCADVPEVQEDDFTGWTHIGSIQVPDAVGLNDFDADGFVDAGKLAFTASIALHGTVAQTTNGAPTRYRFLVAEWASLSTAPSFPADYAPLTSPAITSRPYGAIYDNAIPFPNILSNVSPNPDAQGWIDVDQSPGFKRPSGYPLVEVDTRQLVPSIDKGAPFTAGAGSPVPPAHQDRPRKVSLVLEVSDGTSTVNQDPVSLHINNSLAYARLELQELLSNDCTPITRSGSEVTIHPRFSVGHPYLGSYGISVERQGGDTEVVTDDDFTSHSPTWTDAAGVSASLTHTYHDAAQCSYRVWLSVSRRLTTGSGGVSQGPYLRTFCTP